MSNQKAKFISPLHDSTRSYVNAPDIARNYDIYFNKLNLFDYDSLVLEKWFDRPGKLIDFGCGTGRHLIPFAQRGFNVSGVDLSPHMLDKAKAKLSNHNLSALLIQADFCNIKLATENKPTSEKPISHFIQSSYDHAICMFSTLGLIQGSNNRLNFLKTIQKLLRPDGLFALHVHNFGFNIWRHEGRVFLLKNFVQTQLGLCEHGDKFMSTYRGIKKMYIHVFTEREITELLQRAGFTISELISLNASRTAPVRSDFLRPICANGFLILAQKGHQI